MRIHWKRLGTSLLVALGIGVIFVIIAFPLYWMVITSFKPYKEIFQRVPTFFPKKPVLEHYVSIVQDGLFGYFKNSLIVSVAATAVSVSIGILAAYSISHFRYRGRALFSQLILYVYLFPGAVLFIPLLIVINTLGLTNTLLSLVVCPSPPGSSPAISAPSRGSWRRPPGLTAAAAWERCSGLSFPWLCRESYRPRFTVFCSVGTSFSMLLPLSPRRQKRPCRCGSPNEFSGMYSCGVS